MRNVQLRGIVSEMLTTIEQKTHKIAVNILLQFVAKDSIYHRLANRVIKLSVEVLRNLHALPELPKENAERPSLRTITVLDCIMPYVHELFHSCASTRQTCIRRSHFQGLARREADVFMAKALGTIDCLPMIVFRDEAQVHCATILHLVAANNASRYPSALLTC